jgi:hypothetical protein
VTVLAWATALTGTWVPTAAAQPGPESGYINRFIIEHHAALEPILRAHFVAYYADHGGIASHRLREIIQDTVASEAVCSLDSINSYGDGYQELLLARVDAGDSVSEARYAVQDALAEELAASTYGPDEMENRLRGSHARFQRCLTERMQAQDLPPLPAPTRVSGAP